MGVVFWKRGVGLFGLERSFLGVVNERWNIMRGMRVFVILLFGCRRIFFSDKSYCCCILISNVNSKYSFLLDNKYVFLFKFDKLEYIYTYFY